MSRIVKKQHVQQFGGVSPGYRLGTNYALVDKTAIGALCFDGTAGFPNQLGVVGARPVTGTWTPDAAYTPGESAYSAIMGGYDNVANGLASIVASMHSMVTSDADHGTIVGGSVNGIEKGGYCLIMGGTDNRVLSLRDDGVTVSPGNHGVIIGGLQNRVKNANAGVFSAQAAVVDGQYATVIGGNANKAMGNFDHVSGSNNETRTGTAKTGNKNTIGGGRFNLIDAPVAPVSSTIAGGEDHEIYGSFGAIGGGDNNTIGQAATAANYGVIAGGLDNTNTSANGGTVGGGRSNATSGEYATVSGGQNNTATGNHSAVIGGQANTAAGLHSLAMGYGAVAREIGAVTIGAGFFAVAGDAQASSIVRRIATTNDANTNMAVLALPDDSTWMFEVWMAARRTDADNESAGFVLRGVIDRNTGAATTALVGTVEKTVIGRDVAAWDVFALASSGLVIQVKGEAAKNIRWVARIELTEVSG